MMERIVVVLPMPLRPSSATTVPSLTSMSTPCSTWLSPYHVWMSSIAQASADHPTRGARLVRAHVDVLDGLVGADLVGSALGGDGAEVQQDDALRDPEHEIHVVSDHEHRDLLSERADAFGDVRALRRRQPAARLVQHEQIGRAGETEPHLELSLLAVGQRGHGLVALGPEVDGLEQSLGLLAQRLVTEERPKRGSGQRAYPVAR